MKKLKKESSNNDNSLKYFLILTFIALFFIGIGFIFTTFIFTFLFSI